MRYKAKFTTGFRGILRLLSPGELRKNSLSTFKKIINESLRLIFESPALRRLFNIHYADGKIIW